MLTLGRVRRMRNGDGKRDGGSEIKHKRSLLRVNEHVGVRVVVEGEGILGEGIFLGRRLLREGAVLCRLCGGGGRLFFDPVGLAVFGWLDLQIFFQFQDAVLGEFVKDSAVLLVVLEQGLGSGVAELQLFGGLVDGAVLVNHELNQLFFLLNGERSTFMVVLLYLALGRGSLR
jgi:hypothetical protein